MIKLIFFFTNVLISREEKTKMFVFILYAIGSLCFLAGSVITIVQMINQ